MSEQKFTYTGAYKIRQVGLQIFGVIGTLLFSAFGFGWFAGAIRISNEVPNKNILNDPRVTLICFGVIFISSAWIIGSNFINFLPDIWLSQNGITISIFIFFRKHILWKDVIDIDKGHPPRGYILVRAREITFFHRLFGWSYSKSFWPSFLIGLEIENGDFLIQEIRRNLLI
jgi:hypothetical protein